MKRLAANYLMTENGMFLKNGIFVAEEEGTVVEFVDTKGHLRESGLLSFHNGILISGIEFEKAEQNTFFGENRLQQFIYSCLKDSTILTIFNLVDLGKLVQLNFPEVQIPEIIDEIYKCLLTTGYFRKRAVPGIFLVTGTNLPELKFTSNSRVKKLL